MLFERWHNKNRRRSIKQHIKSSISVVQFRWTTLYMSTNTFGLCTRVLLSAKKALFSGDSRRFLAASRFSSFFSGLVAATGGFGVVATAVALGCCEVALALVAVTLNNAIFGLFSTLCAMWGVRARKRFS